MKTGKRNGVIAFIMTLSLSAMAQNSNWVDHYNSGNNYDHGYDVHLGGDGRIYMGGQAGTSSGSQDALVKSYTTMGVTNWTDTYNGSGNSADYVNAITTYGSGSGTIIYATGTANVSGNGQDMLLLKYTQSGTRTVVTLNSSGSFPDYGNHILVDGSGNIYIAGTSFGASGGTDIKVWKYSSALVLQNTYTYNAAGTQTESVDEMKLDATGSYLYLTGRTEISASNHDAVLIKLSTSGLVQQWAQTWNNSAANNIDQAYSLYIASTGDVFACGKTYVNSTNKYDGLILWYTSGGTLTNAITWNNSSHNLDDFFRSIGTTTIAGTTCVYVCGSTYYDPSANPCDVNMITIKYTVSGSSLTLNWSDEYDAVPNIQCPSYEEGIQLIISSQTGKIHVGGYVTGQLEDYCAIRYSTTGTREVIKTFNRSNSNDRVALKYPMELEYSGCWGGDNIILTGFTTNTSQWDATTIKWYNLGSCARVIGGMAESSMVYPNPFKENAVLHIAGDYNLENSTLEIYDMYGKLVYSHTGFSTTDITITGKGLASGMYFYQLHDPNVKIASGKFILAD
ncbi:MAG: T9SS type A sorting domain-containing protein [Bacteroidota bacterium]